MKLLPCATIPIAWNRYAYVYNSPVNHTDPSGHVIDTVFDALALASDAGSCLGDSDALSCYMLPLDAVFLAVPFATAGGFGDDALRAARGAEEASDIARSPIWDANVNRWRDAQGRFTTPFDILDRSSIRWTQPSASQLFGEGRLKGKTIDEVAQLIREGEIEFNPPLVFRKIAEMDNWEAKVYYGSQGTYRGDFKVLKNGQIYTLNNRGLTLAAALGLDKVPVRWATPEEIMAHSHQFQVDGIAIQIKMELKFP